MAYYTGHLSDCQIIPDPPVCVCGVVCAFSCWLHAFEYLFDKWLVCYMGSWCFKFLENNVFHYNFLEFLHHVHFYGFIWPFFSLFIHFIFYLSVLFSICYWFLCLYFPFIVLFSFPFLNLKALLLVFALEGCSIWVLGDGCYPMI